MHRGGPSSRGGGDRMGYGQNPPPNPPMGRGHYPPPEYGRGGGSSYSHSRPPVSGPPMHAGGAPDPYGGRPRSDYRRDRGGHQGYNPPAPGGRHGGMHNYPPPMDKGPYMQPNRGRSNDMGRGGYDGRYNRGGYNPPAMHTPPMDRRPMRDMRPKRNSRWKDPILKQEISSFFSKYASFILSAKAYHDELDMKNNHGSSQHSETRETQQNAAPAIIPPQIKKPPQEMTNPATTIEEVKNISALTPNLATAQANVQPVHTVQPVQQQQTNGATQESNSAAQGQSQQRPEAAASPAQALTPVPATTGEPSGSSNGAGNAT